MKRNLLFKIGASLLAILLMTACSNEGNEEEQPDTEQTENETKTDEGTEEETE
ncbi:hypothetical protein [Ferdinandcohnia sp. Marseille-Q9671]